MKIFFMFTKVKFFYQDIKKVIDILSMAYKRAFIVGNYKVKVVQVQLTIYYLTTKDIIHRKIK